MGLLGLLKPADSVPVAAVVVAHIDVTTAEAQAVRVEAVPWVSTRRPIVAIVANVVQLTRAVPTQCGQVKIITCVSGRRKGTRCGPAIIVYTCTLIGAVDSSVAVVITFALQYGLLLKPHATFI